MFLKTGYTKIVWKIQKDQNVWHINKVYLSDTYSLNHWHDFSTQCISRNTSLQLWFDLSPVSHKPVSQS